MYERYDANATVAGCVLSVGTLYKMLMIALPNVKHVTFRMSHS